MNNQSSKRTLIPKLNVRKINYIMSLIFLHKFPPFSTCITYHLLTMFRTSYELRPRRRTADNCRKRAGYNIIILEHHHDSEFFL